MVVWLTIAIATAAAFTYYEIGFSRSRIGDLLEGKLALLGLVLGAGTFQYSTWRQIADRTTERLQNPAWQEFERGLARMRQSRTELLAAGQQPQVTDADMAAWEKQHAQWLEFRRASVDSILNDVLPHTRALLANYISIGTGVFFSCTLDVLVLLFGRDVAAWRYVSTALFVATAAPFLESIWRYLYALFYEFNAEEVWFRSQRPDVDGAASNSSPV